MDGNGKRAKILKKDFNSRIQWFVKPTLKNNLRNKEPSSLNMILWSRLVLLLIHKHSLQPSNKLDMNMRWDWGTGSKQNRGIQHGNLEQDYKAFLECSPNIRLQVPPWPLCRFELNCLWRRQNSMFKYLSLSIQWILCTLAQK